MVKTVSIVVNGMSVPFFGSVINQQLKGQILWPKQMYNNHQNEHINVWLKVNDWKVKERLINEMLIENN